MVASNVTNLHMELPTELTSKVTHGANKHGLKANLAKDTQLNSTLSNAELDPLLVAAEN